FAAQLADQQEQLHDLRLQLAQVDATLSKLRSQRDILQARLKAAQAEMNVGRASILRLPHRRRWAVLVAATGLAVLVAGVLSFRIRSVRQETVREAPSTQMQQAAYDGLIVRSVRAARILPIEEVYLGKVPDPLIGARAFTIPFDRRNNIDAEGAIEIEVMRDQPLYVAVSWANDHLGEWMREAMLKTDFAPAGWTLVGELPALGSSGKREYRSLYWRSGKKGEVFRVRTRKAVAPMAIAPRPGAPAPTGEYLKAPEPPPTVRPAPLPTNSPSAANDAPLAGVPPTWPGHDEAGWSSLAWLVDPGRDTENAAWTITGDTVEFSAQKPRAYVSVPMAIGGSYELSAGIEIVRAKETLALHLPVGDKAIVLDIRGDNGNTESPTATIRLLGLAPEPTPEQSPSITIGKEHQYTVHVAVTGGNASIFVGRDAQPLFRWSGPLSALSGKNIRPGTIGFETAYYSISRIRGLRLKTIAGEAKPIAAE
ncbi:MAG TPA: hypothetical protein VHY91_00735, partial [Pirellulales bacterium]|nr:hypothetical protein [Pirellulales bacterium]